MGACIGKKSSKYSKKKQTHSDKIQAPQIIIQDEVVEKKPSPPSSKILPGSNDPSVNENNDDLNRLSGIDQASINSELQLILDAQNTINETLCQPFPSRIISTTESELLLELANLEFEQSENNQTNKSLNIPTDNNNITK